MIQFSKQTHKMPLVFCYQFSLTVVYISFSVSMDFKSLTLLMEIISLLDMSTFGSIGEFEILNEFSSIF